MEENLVLCTSTGMILNLNHAVEMAVLVWFIFSIVSSLSLLSLSLFSLSLFSLSLSLSLSLSPLLVLLIKSVLLNKNIFIMQLTAYGMSGKHGLLVQSHVVEESKLVHGENSCQKWWQGLRRIRHSRARLQH